MAIRRLQLSDPPDPQQINRWASDVNGNLDRIHEIATKANTIANTTSSTVSTSTGPAPHVTSPQISEQGVLVDGNLYSEIVASYVSPNPIGNFAGIFLVIQGYLGNSNFVKVAEDNFSGAGGVTHSFQIKLERTNENVAFFFVSKNGLNATEANWGASPTVTSIVLDGNSTAPIAPTIAAVNAADLGIWIEWFGNPETNIQGYKLYRNTVNTFGTAGVIYTVGSGQQTGGVYFYYDKNQGTFGTTYYYWLVAVNNSNQSSLPSTSGSAIWEGILNSIQLGPINAVGTMTTATGVLTQSGTGTTINVAASTWNFNAVGASPITINYSSGSVNPGGYGKYYVYADDPYGQGGAVTYHATLTFTDLFATRGRLDFGTITTVNTGGGSGGGFQGGGGPGCVVAGTPIETVNGPKPVEQLSVGDLLVTPYGSASIESLWTVDTEDVYELTFSDNSTLRCSGTHLLRVNGLWQRVSELYLDDPANLRVFAPVSKYVLSRKSCPREPVYKLHLTEHHIYLAGDVWAHNVKTA